MRGVGVGIYTYILILSRYASLAPLALYGKVSAVLVVKVEIISIHALVTARIRALDDGKSTLLKMTLCVCVCFVIVNCTSNTQPIN